MANNIGLFFNTSKNTRSFAEVLAQVQEYLASKYSTLMTENPEEQRQQITAYIAKYLNDYSLGVEGMDHEALIDKLYTEMAEFSFLTPYLFASDVEEININSWKDTKITYADGRVVALVLALVVRIAPVFVAKQNLDVFADELVRTAEINGRVGSATSAKAADLREETGLDPDISWSDTGKIQLGNEVTVTLTTTVNLGLFGEFASFPVTLTARATGVSEVYWK